MSQGRQTSMLRDEAQARRVLDRLVRRAVLAEADRIVREDEDRAQLHQRRHAQRVARVVGEREEGADVRDEAAVQREAVGDRAHRELAHAEVDVVARRASRVTGLLPDQLVNTEPVRSAEPPIISGSAGAAPRSPAATPCAWRRSRPSRPARRRTRRRRAAKSARQLARHAAREFGGERRDARRGRRRTARSSRASSSAPHSRALHAA